MEVSFGEYAFDAWIRRRPVRKLQTALAVNVSGTGVVFSEAQLACPLRIGNKSLAQTENQSISVKRFIVEPDTSAVRKVQYDCIKDRQGFDFGMRRRDMRVWIDTGARLNANRHWK